jgi:hypothetical protein
MSTVEGCTQEFAFRRAAGTDAGWARANWFSLALIVAAHFQAGTRVSTGKLQRPTHAEVKKRYGVK